MFQTWLGNVLTTSHICFFWLGRDLEVVDMFELLPLHPPCFSLVPIPPLALLPFGIPGALLKALALPCGWKSCFLYLKHMRQDPFDV